MTQITTVARSTSNGIRCHTHPVLETGNLSYPDGRYTVVFEPGNDQSSFYLAHNVDGSPFVSRLIENGQAVYACIVSSPISSYRRTHLSNESRHEVRWNADDLGEPPLFTPMILSGITGEYVVNSKTDGVHSVWDGSLISIQKGSRLAVGSVVRLQSSIFQMLSIQKDETLGNGRFFVDAETEPFRFLVKTSPDLHDFLRFRIEDPIRKNIMTHIVTACLALLQRDFYDDNDEEGWNTHRSLRALSDFLTNKGLPCWYDQGFRPEKVATELYEHLLPSRDEEEDE
ncbi:MAG: hypothetical protein F4X08_01245 [Gemmatimonadetes bacterium]|nr:hypothetical protein [Gemmatimonadota bacterium]